MRSADFDALIIDYLEDALPDDVRKQFETARQTMPELQRLFEGYQKVLGLTGAISKESYAVSPGFKYRVMDAIEAEAEKSFVSTIKRYFALDAKQLTGALTASAVIMFMLVFGWQQIKPFIQQGIPTVVEQPDGFEDAPIVIRNTAPIMIARFASTGQRLDVTPGAKSQKESAIENLLNAIGAPFSAGTQIPLAVSMEVIRSPLNHSQVILRTTLTSNPFEQESGAVARNIKVEYLFSGKTIEAIEPLGSEYEKIERPEGRLLWATGEEMIVDQQFTSLAVLTVGPDAVSKDPDAKLFEILVSFDDVEKGTKAIERVPVYVRDVKFEFQQASSSLQRAFWMLYQEKLSPGAFSNIDPQAYGEFYKQIEGLVKQHMSTFANPNPENLEQFKRHLESMRVPNLLRKDHRIVIPDVMLKRYPRSVLKKRFPNAVDERGKPL